MRWQENTLAKNPSSAWVLLFLFVEMASGQLAKK
jgi:hypothetical protein